MGNVVGAIFSGFAQVVGKILGHPLDFLSGKSCNSICGSTWDILCYIENFCVTHLLKLGMVATLSYFVLLFFYLLFNLGICQCICRTLCGVVWACFASCFSALDFCCTYLCFKLRTIKRKRRRRKRDLEEFAATSEEDCELGERSVTQQTRNLEHGRSQFSKRRDYKNVRLRRSLRPSTHRPRMKLPGSSIHHHRRKILNNFGEQCSPVHHHIRVTRSTKGSRHRTGIRHRRRQIVRM
ncbi:UNVERIFIED_CONTAM: hypothetical protein Sangu_0192500 [Sesamum angustifolium]|uniref:Uncharacterized protein n=1 Tax=Sesamum angustifolium TaxID=2727405 RepID=A0AAW2RMH8_9LAMI